MVVLILQKLCLEDAVLTVVPLLLHHLFNSFQAVFPCFYFICIKLEVLTPGDCSHLWDFLHEIEDDQPWVKNFWMQLAAIKVRLSYDFPCV